MIKPIVSGVLRQFGYRVQRIAPAAQVTQPPRPSVPLQPVRVELFPGWPVELDLSDGLPREALQNAQSYEAPCPQLLRTFCATPESVFFDIGANFGYYSYYMLAHCPKLTVHSFEPNPAHVGRA